MLFRLLWIGTALFLAALWVGWTTRHRWAPPLLHAELAAWGQEHLGAALTFDELRWDRSALTLHGLRTEGDENAPLAAGSSWSARTVRLRYDPRRIGADGLGALLALEVEGAKLSLVPEPGESTPWLGMDPPVAIPFVRIREAELALESPEGSVRIEQLNAVVFGRPAVHAGDTVVERREAWRDTSARLELDAGTTRLRVGERSFAVDGWSTVAGLLGGRVVLDALDLDGHRWLEHTELDLVEYLADGTLRDPRASGTLRLADAAPAEENGSSSRVEWELASNDSEWVIDARAERGSLSELLSRNPRDFPALAGNLDGHAHVIVPKEDPARARGNVELSWNDGRYGSHAPFSLSLRGSIGDGRARVDVLRFLQNENSVQITAAELPLERDWRNVLQSARGHCVVDAAALTPWLEECARWGIETERWPAIPDRLRLGASFQPGRAEVATAELLAPGLRARARDSVFEWTTNWPHELADRSVPWREASGAFELEVDDATRWPALAEWLGGDVSLRGEWSATARHLSRSTDVPRLERAFARDGRAPTPRPSRVGLPER